MFIVLILCTMVSICNSAVLDPALYLSPRPPASSPNIGSLWSTDSRLSELAADKGETASKSRTFWPKIRTDYRLGGIHIPLTFSLSGSYGGHVPDGGSVIGTSYADISGISSAKIISSNNKPSLIGAQYEVFYAGPPMVRIFGGNNKPAWSGWGNGKWGHYGKG